MENHAGKRLPIEEINPKTVSLPGLIDNQNGSVMIIALMIMAVMIILAVASTDTVITENAIVRNVGIHRENVSLVESALMLGLQEFMLNLDGEEVIEFAAETKVSRLDWFKGFMDELPKVINFSEIATRGTNVGGGNAGEKLETLVKEKMEKNDKLNYSQAFSLVQKEHPDLVTEYQQEMGAAVIK